MSKNAYTSKHWIYEDMESLTNLDNCIRCGRHAKNCALHLYYLTSDREAKKYCKIFLIKCLLSRINMLLLPLA